MIVASVVGSIRRARRMREEQARYEEEMRRREESGEPPESPFGGSPFGPLFDTLFSGAGMRSYQYDPQTGEWVDMTEIEPEPVEQGAKSENGSKRKRETRKHRRKTPQTGFSPFGMMGGDGSGDFEVEDPGELNPGAPSTSSSPPSRRTATSDS